MGRGRWRLFLLRFARDLGRAHTAFARDWVVWVRVVVYSGWYEKDWAGGGVGGVAGVLRAVWADAITSGAWWSAGVWVAWSAVVFGALWWGAFCVSDGRASVEAGGGQFAAWECGAYSEVPAVSFVDEAGPGVCDVCAAWGEGWWWGWPVGAVGEEAGCGAGFSTCADGAGPGVRAGDAEGGDQAGGQGIKPALAARGVVCYCGGATRECGCPVCLPVLKQWSRKACEGTPTSDPSW